MAAATADRDGKRQEGLIKAHKMAAVKIYKNTLVNRNTSGYARAAGDVASETFAGVAVEQKNNSSGSAGDTVVRVYKTGEFELAGAGFALADEGKEVYVTDDSTVQTAANTNGEKVGVISEFVSSTKVRVRIDNYAR